MGEEVKPGADPKRQRWRTEVDYDGTTIRYRSDPMIRLMCESCGDYFTKVAALEHHTLQLHERRPTVLERTPR